VAARAPEAPQDGTADTADTAGTDPAAGEADASAPGADEPDAAKPAAEATTDDGKTADTKIIEVKIVEAKAAEAKAIEAVGIEAGDAEAEQAEASAEDSPANADAADDDAAHDDGKAAPSAAEALAASGAAAIKVALGSEALIASAAIAASALEAVTPETATTDSEESPTIPAPIKADQPVPVTVQVAVSASTPQAPAPPRPSRPVPPEKDPWWSTAYQQQQQRPAQPDSGRQGGYPGSRPASQYRPGPSQPGPATSYPEPATQLAFPDSVGQHPGSVGQNPGQHPDSVGQHPGRRGRGARKALLAVVVAVVVAAVAVVAIVLAMHRSTTSQAARNGPTTRTSPVSSTGAIPPLTKDTPGVIVAIDQPSTTLPTGLTAQSFPPSQTGTMAGFSMAVPPGWQARQQPGSPKQVFYKAPDGVSFVEVELTAQHTSDMVAALQSIRMQAMAQNRFPGYKLLDFAAQDVLRTRGALWRFDWVNASGVQMRVDDMLFTLPTKNGPQAYAIYMTTPEGTGPGKWGGSDGLQATTINPMLRSFQPAT
jgi:hypothetical protein